MSKLKFNETSATLKCVILLLALAVATLGCQRETPEERKQVESEVAISSEPAVTHQPKDKKVENATSFLRTRPKSRVHKIEKSTQYGVTELALKFGKVAQDDSSFTDARIVYGYFGNSPPLKTKWSSVELIVTVVSPTRRGKNPVTGGTWNRGLIGYGESVFQIDIDGSDKSYRAELIAEESGHLMCEALRMPVSKELASRLYSGKQVVVRCGSQEASVKFELDDEMLAGFCDFIDRVFVYRE